MDIKAGLRGTAYGQALHKAVVIYATSRPTESDDPLRCELVKHDVDCEVLKLAGIARIRSPLYTWHAGRESMLDLLAQFAHQGPISADHALCAFSEPWQYTKRDLLMVAGRQQMFNLPKLAHVVANQFEALRDWSQTKEAVLLPHGGQWQLDGILPVPAK